MMPSLKNGRRGFAVVEFTITAIPIILITMSIIEVSLQSWKFHSMDYAISAAARYACAHGRTCTKNSNTCTIKVKDVAKVITQQAPWLDSGTLNVTLKTASHTVNCQPLNTCTTNNCGAGATCTDNTDQFPNAADNGVGLDVSITATYQMHNPLQMFWFGAGTANGNSYTLGATTRQTIVY